MKKIKSQLIAETEAAKEVCERVIRLFTEIGYSLTSGQQNPFFLKLNPELTADIKLETNDIVGKNPAALFRGTVRFLVKQVMKKPIPQSFVPHLEESILMLDIGRKYYSLAELKRLVRSMALFQFTHLQLHFSENEGFGIESLRHPEIVSKEQLSQAEIKELIAYAKQFYLEIIPDIDSPGHLQQVLRNYPEWQLATTEGRRDDKALDISNPEAVAFIKEIYKEFAELFKESQYFHIGADEFFDFDQLESYPSLKKAAQAQYGRSASGIEVFIDYVNDLSAFLTGLGFQVRVWNDGFYRINRQEQVHLSKKCGISYWTRWNQHMAPIETYFDQEYTVINHNDNFLYYVLGEAAGYSYPTYEKINQQFQLTTFANDQKVDNLSHTKGIAISVWADIPEAKEANEVVKDLFWLQAALNEKVYADAGEKNDYRTLFEHWSE